ncbi:PAS domain S-box protein [Methanocalculus taiwanensis]|uniref:histidine kinase n=1 Tax=Methanocalculus taiwanensis TaxID=106207 RepID=A0ABD4TMV6_9EURY|nr:PAS domain S-box protein [Methanocalculus taiwanensis]MCQ1539103.1 PAS domain S-box protein [Methanocalculus taiwanensis]
MPDTGAVKAKISILYVDDEAGLLQIGKIYLERSGEFAVTTLESALDAVRLLSETSFDAIISDYQMPGCDGIRFLKYLRENGDKTPFIIFTGKGREDIVIDALNNGADFYLQKGGDPKPQFAELSNKVRYAVSKRRSEKALLDSEERYRTVVEVQTELICRFLPDGTILFVNDAYCRTFNVSRESVIGSRFKPKIHPDDLRKVSLLYDSLIPKHPSATIDQRTIMGNGEIRWHRWSTYALFDERGALSEYQAVGKDITDLIERDIELQRRNDEINAAYEQLTAAEEELRQQLDELTEVQSSLYESRQQLRIILDHSYDGIIISDSDGTIIDVNQTMLEMFGIPYEDALRSQISDFFSTDTGGNGYDPGLKAVLSKTGELTALTARRSEDGTLFDVEVFRSRIVFEGRELYLSNVRDLTDRKLADEAIRHRILIDQSRDGIVTLEQDGKVFESNQRFADMLGYTQDEIRDLCVWDWDFQFEPETLRKMLRSVDEKGDHFETLHRKKDGTVLSVEISTNAALFSGKKLIFCVVRDISDRKRAEEALRLSEEKYRMIADNMTETVTVLDLSLKAIYVSPSITVLRGFSVDEAMQQSLEEILAPESLQLALSRFEEELASEKDKPADPNRVITLDLEVRKKDGSTIWVNNNARFLRDNNGGLQSILVVSRNITEKKLAEDALRNANRQLNLMTSITRHDILNQLMIIDGYLYFAKAEATGNESLIRQLESIGRSSEKIQRQIEFTRVYQDIGVHEPQWHDLDRILPRTDVPDGVSFTSDTGKITLFADPMIPRVFDNLLDNSLRHGERVSLIRLSCKQSDEALIITWEDDGIGVPEDEKIKIFDRGYGKNTGFGLFLSKEILGITGITIRETGLLGEGARFEIRIPKGEFRIPAVSQCVS